MRRYELPLHRGSLLDIGPELAVNVGPSRPELEAANRSGKTLPDPQRVNAVIDTGARRTVITPQAAQRCGLLAVSRTKVFVVGGGEVTGDVFSARIVFPSPLGTWPAIDIVAANLFASRIECLIGRDVLRRWIVTYDGPSGLLAIEEHE
ncbi:MAG: retroviral-like aspartic protease family protein [Acidobacteria bacterium]|nr:retroviral-like aspartic protease family protein [Acidobacteriota bacterium]